MAANPPELRSRRQRLIAYVHFNRTRMTVDVLVVVAWILVNLSVFGWFSLPTWLLYVSIFVGVIVYTRISPTWQRPYRSPDLPE